MEMIKTLYYLLKIKKNSRLSRDKLGKQRFADLKKILIHAYKNTEYYKKVFDECKFNPYTFTKIKEIEKIPVLTKEVITRNYDNIISKKLDSKNVIMHTTSGSTGIPLKIYNDINAETVNIALRYRSYIENNLKISDVIFDITSPEYQDLKETLFQKIGFFKKYRASIFDDEINIVKKMNKVKPKIILGYPSILYLISKKIQKGTLKFKPKVIFTSSEVLSEKIRSEISRKFNCPIRDMYGCEEFSRLAWECEKQEGYHLDIDCHIIEFLDEKNKKTTTNNGSIVVTSLVNYAFPFIRYKLGDVAELTSKKCSCGRTFPIIKSIQGREDDFIKLPSGKTVSPRGINMIENINGVHHYKTTQLKRDLFHVSLVKSKGFSKNTIDEVKKQIRLGCLGEAVEIEIEIVDKIEKEKSGKIRTVISLVK